MTDATSSTAPHMPSFPQSSIEWKQTIELGYVDTTPTPSYTVCFSCQTQLQSKSSSDTTAPAPKYCSKCQTAAYCSRDCQVKDWKQHKLSCDSLKRVGRDMKLSSQEDAHAALVQVFHRVRLYVCPYAVVASEKLGKGFCFVQSSCTLAVLSLAKPQDSYGRYIGLPNKGDDLTTTTTLLEKRSLLVHYLTLGEFDAEVCRDDFELASMRFALKSAIDNYDSDTHIVLLWRTRCGHLSLGVAPLVPDFAACRSLGHAYYEDAPPCLQLNLDDV